MAWASSSGTGLSARASPEGLSVSPGLSRHTVLVEDANDVATAEPVRAALGSDAGRFRDWCVEPS